LFEEDTVSDLFAALALAIVIEGLLYAAFPEQMKRMVAQLLTLPSQQLRLAALGMAGVGLVLLACKWQSSALPVLTYQMYAPLRFSKITIFGSP
jgi:hypothetical protein